MHFFSLKIKETTIFGQSSLCVKQMLWIMIIKHNNNNISSLAEACNIGEYAHLPTLLLQTHRPHVIILSLVTWPHWSMMVKQTHHWVSPDTPAIASRTTITIKSTPLPTLGRNQINFVVNLDILLKRHSLEKQPSVFVCLLWYIECMKEQQPKMYQHHHWLTGSLKLLLFASAINNWRRGADMQIMRNW